MARASLADARTIVRAKGILQRVESDLTAGGRDGLCLLNGVMDSNDPAIHAHVAEHRTLLRALVMMLTRPTPREPDAAFVVAALALEKLVAGGAALAGACADVLDALSDAELKALVEATAIDTLTLPVTSLLTHCLLLHSDHAPLVGRLAGQAELPRAMAQRLVSPGSSEDVWNEATHCILGLVASTRTCGPPPATWAKPIIQPLRSIVAKHVKGAAPSSLILQTGILLRTLSTVFDLKPSLARGLPDYVAVLRGGGAASVQVATLVGNLSTHPGVRTAALREGAVPALVALLCPRGGEPPEAAVSAFRALSTLSEYAESRKAILAEADAQARLLDTLRKVVVPGLTLNSPFGADINIVALLIAVFKVHHHGLVPPEALVGTGALAKVVQLLQSCDDQIIVLLATDFVLTTLKWTAADAGTVVDACRAALHAFGPAGLRFRSGIGQLLEIIARCVCSWTPVPHQPRRRDGLQEIDAAAWAPPARGRALAELLVADAVWVSILCSAVMTRPEDAFVRDLRDVASPEKACARAASSTT